jgi:hypothetical protein
MIPTYLDEVFKISHSTAPTLKHRSPDGGVTAS